jgi:sterol desaturase/sphingolipid hydroxylase (fatty acid hydroxylase superfamily)
MLLKLIAIFATCFVIERIWPGWKLPSVKTWPWRVVAINLAQIGVVLLASVTWEKWLGSYSVFHLSEHMEPITGGIFAYFVATFIFYWWHRARHENDFLWRVFHQIHHSPVRLEVITSFYKHPIEMIANSIIGSLLVFTLLGLSIESSLVYTACCALGEYFYHTSIRTPRWIGYFFQRPEMHRIHHQMDRHKNNYGDIVWWDMLFGTYENPAMFDGRCGFSDEREERLADMLLFKDVHKEKQA